VPDMDEAPGQMTPTAARPPPLAADVDAALRDSIRRVPRMTNDVASLARQQMDSDSVDFGNF